MKNIAFTKAASKQLMKLDTTTRANVLKKISQLADGSDAQANNIKQLQGSENEFRLRIADLRVLFTTDADTTTIHAIRHRREAYR